jgi:NAD(P)-dependent dehydrogenase (short-subunit alcohol dehydrogenase family)
VNALQQADLNVVVAGDGGIGTAIATTLLQQYPVKTLFLLQRSDRRSIDDPRCIYLAVDAHEPASIAAAGDAIGQHCDALHLVINTVGMLHNAETRPEKRLKDVSLASMLSLATVNAFFLPQLAAAVAPLLRHSQASILASLSARVGSISDNEMGGWYSYRASKAAHNMLLKTLAREWRISHQHCSVIALHPGTVDTALSQPYTPANYTKRVLSPQQCAAALLTVLAATSPQQTGSFLAWDGAEIPW